MAPSSEPRICEMDWPPVVPSPPDRGGPLAEVLAVLTDQALLPGETYRTRLGGAEEGEVVACPRTLGGQVVILPREAFHSGSVPLVGLLATVDELEEDAGRIVYWRAYGLRRVRVLEVGWHGPALRAWFAEVERESAPPQGAVPRLQRLARRVARKHGHAFDPAGEVTAGPAGPGDPDSVADWIARQAEPSQDDRLWLLQTVSWVDRLPVLERCARVSTWPRTRQRRTSDRGSLEARVRAAKLPAEVREVVERYLKEPSGLHGSPGREAAEVALELVWDAPEPPELNLGEVRETLDRSHFGMEGAKQAFLELAATVEWGRRQGRASAPGRSICLVGPSGTGKTTIAGAAAQALGRRLEAIHLGGMDDLGLVGADRTYSRSRPGHLVRRLREARLHPSQVAFLLDEIDKVRRDPFRSPLPVLLALLDPGQNSGFEDRFLDGLRVDLSGALFIATANDWEAIAPPLRDRLERVELRRYTPEELLQIGRTWLLPRLASELGLRDGVVVRDSALEELVFGPPGADGCRELERRLRRLVSRGLTAHMQTGQAVVVDARQARAWVPIEAERQSIGFRAWPGGPAGTGFQRQPGRGVPNPAAGRAVTSVGRRGGP